MRTKWSMPRLWQMMAEDPAGGAGDPPVDPPVAADPPAGDPPAGDPPDDKTGQGFWPDGWQDRMSDGDDKAAKHVSRYTSPGEVYKALVAAQNKIRSGDLKATLAEDATDDEVKAWREDNGIPEEASGYDLKLASGVVIGEEDQPSMDAFLKVAHDGNMAPGDVQRVVEWYYGNREAQLDALADVDEKQQELATDDLREEWGPDYRRNVNMVNNLIDATFPEAVRPMFKEARMPDGALFFNSPDVVKGLAAMALQANPTATVVPAGGGDIGKGIDAEIAEIDKAMRENRKAYNADDKMQARYRELLDAQSRQKAS